MDGIGRRWTRRVAALAACVVAAVGLAACADDPSVNLGADASLPRHTLYSPKDLSGAKLPIVVWGEGGCVLSGTSYNAFLSAVAARGYLVIASNNPYQNGATTPAMLTEAITWAIAENTKPGSASAGRIDTTKIAVMGQSCGGIEALLVGKDPRATTVVAWNSGIFPSGLLGATKENLKDLHTPTLWVNGGPSDIAYPQAETDYELVPATVPAVWANFGDVGHLGTFFSPQGGEFARIAGLWLDWHLKGATANRAQFVGTACGLCSGSDWKVQSKHW